MKLMQVLHRLDVTINRGAEGLTNKVFIGDISEDKAVELAGKFISEAFIWTVRASLLDFANYVLFLHLPPVLPCKAP